MANKSRMDETTFIAEDVNRTSLNFFRDFKISLFRLISPGFLKNKKNPQLPTFKVFRLTGLRRELHYNPDSHAQPLQCYCSGKCINNLISNAPLICP